MRELSFERIAAPAGPLLFICDHAANSLPDSYRTLGLEAGLFATHIACDIGAAEVARTLAAEFAAPAILGRWSRLLIDLNRGADDPTLVMQISDGHIIPGNRTLVPQEIARRVSEYHVPYHDAVEAELLESRESGLVPVIVSIHSFTPSWKGVRRPWEVSVLWDRDARLAQPLLVALSEAGFVVGDNQPYSGALENDCLYRHGTMNGYPHALIEVRQDLVATERAARAFALRLKPILEKALHAMGEPSIRFTRPPANNRGASIMDEETRLALEAAVFERLVAHLRARTDVQNIEMMAIAGFCRNCLGDWYREAAAEKGIRLEKDEAREIVYGMPPAEWKKRYQKEATPEQLAAFEQAQKTHSHDS